MTSRATVVTAARAEASCGRCFSIAGVDVLVETDDEGMLASATVLLEHFGFAPSAGGTVPTPSLRLRVTRRRLPKVAPNAAVIAHHLDLVVRSDGDILHVDDGRSVCRIDLDAGRAVLSVQSWPSGPAAGRPYLIVVYTLLTLLRRRGLVPLHAAALERGGSGMLIVAPSGSGKSTMTLMLLRSGWTLVSDDSLLLRREADEEIRAYGLRRDLFLRTPESDFPDLAELWTSAPELDRGKRRLVVDRVFPGRVVRACRPRCILMPELTDAVLSRLVPCPVDEVLFRLLDHSTLADLEPGAARAHVEVLGRLVRQTRNWVLEAGADLLAERSRLAGLVEPLLEAEGPGIVDSRP